MPVLFESKRWPSMSIPYKAEGCDPCTKVERRRSHHVLDICFCLGPAEGACLPACLW